MMGTTQRDGRYRALAQIVRGGARELAPSPLPVSLSQERSSEATCTEEGGDQRCWPKRL